MSATLDQTFRTAALQYCRSVEGQTLDLAGILRALVRLVDGALSLPVVDVTDDTPHDPPRLKEDAEQLVRRVEEALRLWDLYWVVGDPLITTAEAAAGPPQVPTQGALSDDLRDIYCDVRRGFALVEAGKQDAAIWHWRFGFYTHWGVHATDAIRVLHRIESIEDRNRIVRGS